MRRLAGIIVLMISLLGCSADNSHMDSAMQLRSQLCNATTCSFTATVTAEYESYIYQFVMDCVVNADQVLHFILSSPESISGITGRITDIDASLTFDDAILAFPLLAEGELSPVSGPWVFYDCLKNGYLSACGKNADGLLLSIDDSYEENPLHVDIQLDQQLYPVLAEIYWNQRRVLTLEIMNFKIM